MEEPDWTVGDALSDFEKFDAGDATGGVIDIVNLSGAPSTGAESDPAFPEGGGGSQAIRLIHNPAEANLQALTRNNAMGNNSRVDGKLWGAVDIYKGEGESGFIWNLCWTRGTTATLMCIDGFFDTVRLRQLNEVSNSFDLRDGWNQIVVMNDVNSNPNITMWLNGDVVAQINGGGDAANSNAKLQRAYLTSQGRPGPFDGEIFFDNIYGGNEPPVIDKYIFAVPTLSQWGVIVLALFLSGLGFFQVRRQRV